MIGKIAPIRVTEQSHPWSVQKELQQREDQPSSQRMRLQGLVFQEVPHMHKVCLFVSPGNNTKHKVSQQKLSV